MTPLEGITLEQYAGITVALAEGHPLPAILANESLPPEAWPPASAAWTARIAKDGAQGPVFAAFADKRSVAEDWLFRRVEPIDADLGAWIGFLHAWAEHPSPFEMLDRAGIGMNDVARLQRRWARVMASDKAVEKQAADLAKKGAGPLPVIRAQPGQLKPFPWSKGAPKIVEAPIVPKGPSPGIASVLDVSFYRYVAAKARLAEEPGNQAAVLKKLGYDDFAKIDGVWQARLKDDPVLAGDYKQLLQHERGRARAAAKNAESAPRAQAPLPRAPEPPPAPAPPLALPPAPPAPSALAGTSLALDLPLGPALPFAAATSAEANDTPGTPALPVVPARSPLAGTSLALDLPLGPALPFAAASSVEPEPAPNKPALPVVPARSALAGTSLALDLPLGPALPFAEQRPASARPPMPEPTVPAASAAPPSLSLEQHASLCFELSATPPERAAETLARYRIAPAEKQAADQHYAERFAREPGLREAWQRAFDTYRAWWHENARRGT